MLIRLQETDHSAKIAFGQTTRHEPREMEVKEAQSYPTPCHLSPITCSPIPYFGSSGDSLGGSIRGFIEY